MDMHDSPTAYKAVLLSIIQRYQSEGYVFERSLRVTGPGVLLNGEPITNETPLLQQIHVELHHAGASYTTTLGENWGVRSYMDSLILAIRDCLPESERRRRDNAERLTPAMRRNFEAVAPFFNAHGGITSALGISRQIGGITPNAVDRIGRFHGYHRLTKYAAYRLIKDFQLKGVCVTDIRRSWMRLHPEVFPTPEIMRIEFNKVRISYQIPNKKDPTQLHEVDTYRVYFTLRDTHTGDILCSDLIPGYTASDTITAAYGHLSNFTIISEITNV